MEKYEVLFLTGLFPKETEKEIAANSKGSIQNAANVLQWNFVKGFDDNNIDLKIYNLLYIGSFPFRYKKMMIKNYHFSHNGSSDDLNVGFCNISVVKYFSRTRAIKKQVKKWVKEKTSSKKIIFAYAMTNPFDKALQYVKSIDKNVTTCLVVPDLPQFMNTDSKAPLYYRVLKKIDVSRQFRYAKSIDSFVFLTEKMSNYFPNKPYTVVEGISSSTNNCESVKSDWEGKHLVFYAGGLKEKYGIIHLIDSFKLLDSNKYVLIICGDGECKDYVKRESEKQTNIIYLGQIDRNKILGYEKISSVLVNPRIDDGEEYIQYSFPSKILEYLSHKKPVVCYKLRGIPNEYDSVLFYPSDNSKEMLAKTIEKAANLNKKEQEMYEQRVASLLETKTPKAQVKKVLDFISSIVGS